MGPENCRSGGWPCPANLAALSPPLCPDGVVAPVDPPRLPRPSRLLSATVSGTSAVGTAKSPPRLRFVGGPEASSGQGWTGTGPPPGVAPPPPGPGLGAGGCGVAAPGWGNAAAAVRTGVDPPAPAAWAPGLAALAITSWLRWRAAALARRPPGSSFCWIDFLYFTMRSQGTSRPSFTKSAALSRTSACSLATFMASKRLYTLCWSWKDIRFSFGML
mmetsp:Transcript_105939/g.330388  ORF Transcript_105939/g.330388 Transcript_105939/m.330388 type:complete len:217 (+) Transcript_105939:632-1282(+)